MKHRSWLSAALIVLVLFLFQSVVFAERMAYKTDKFTDEKILSSDFWLYPVKQSVFEASSSYHLHLSHKVGEPLNASLIADFDGS